MRGDQVDMQNMPLCMQDTPALIFLGDLVGCTLKCAIATCPNLKSHLTVRPIPNRQHPRSRTISPEG